MRSGIHNEFISNSRFDCFGESLPSVAEGWDFYEIAQLDRGNLVFFIGKVNESGITGSLTVASVKAILHGLRDHYRDAASELIHDLNRILYEIPTSRFYAPLFYGRIDPLTGNLQYASAGHAPVLLIHARDSRVRRLETTGAVLGLTLRAGYRQRAVQLEAGDIIVATSDGVNDVLREQDIVNLARRHAQEPPSVLVREILGSSHSMQDCTALAVRFKGRAGAGMFECHGAEAVPAAA